MPKATTNPSFAERIALAFITIEYLIHGSRPWCSGAHLAGQPHTCVRFAALFLLMQVAEYCGPRRLGSSIRPLCDDAEPRLFHGWSDNQERSSEYLSFSKAFPKRLLFSVSPTAEDCSSAWPRSGAPLRGLREQKTDRLATSHTSKKTEKHGNNEQQKERKVAYIYSQKYSAKRDR